MCVCVITYICVNETNQNNLGQNSCCAVKQKPTHPFLRKQFPSCTSHIRHGDQSLKSNGMSNDSADHSTRQTPHLGD